MKFLLTEIIIPSPIVTPLAGVWIEILSFLYADAAASTSLPSRECGLKSRRKRRSCTGATGSLPSRECGLKFTVFHVFAGYTLSLPSRECGLKLVPSVCSKCKGTVTPLAGVWIEIYNRYTPCYMCIVTPLAGVWIEI